MGETDEMKVSNIDPARAQALISQLTEVQQRITAVAKGRPVSSKSPSQSHLNLNFNGHTSPHLPAHPTDTRPLPFAFRFVLSQSPNSNLPMTSSPSTNRPSHTRTLAKTTPKNSSKKPPCSRALSSGTLLAACSPRIARLSPRSRICTP